MARCRTVPKSKTVLCSSKDRSRTAYQQHISVKPPTPSAPDLGRWKWMSQVGIENQSGLVGRVQVAKGKPSLSHLCVFTSLLWLLTTSLLLWGKKTLWNPVGFSGLSIPLKGWGFFFSLGVLVFLEFLLLLLLFSFGWQYLPFLLLFLWCPLHIWFKARRMKGRENQKKGWKKMRGLGCQKTCYEVMSERGWNRGWCFVLFVCFQKECGCCWVFFRNKITGQKCCSWVPIGFSDVILNSKHVEMGVCMCVCVYSFPPELLKAIGQAKPQKEGLTKRRGVTLAELVGRNQKEEGRS